MKVSEKDIPREFLEEAIKRIEEKGGKRENLIFEKEGNSIMVVDKVTFKGVIIGL